MNVLSKLSRNLGILNRYGELQVLNIMLVGAYIKAWINPYMELSLFLFVVTILCSVKWYYDNKLRRGIWAELVKLEQQQKDLQSITHDLSLTSEEVKLRLAELSNKVQFMK